MDIHKILGELQRERKLLDEAIDALEKLPFLQEGVRPGPSMVGPPRGNALGRGREVSANPQ